MVEASSSPGRADAQRNRQRLIDAAVAAFSSGQGPVVLEQIARDAGVGIGTLYRHFPSREALVEAVYGNELARLCRSAEQLLALQAPDDALHAWMQGYVEFVRTKRGMGDTLRAAMTSGSITFSQTRATLIAAIQTLLDAGAAAGTLRADVPADDVCAALVGVVLAAGAPHQHDQALRLLDLLMDGLRAPPDCRG
ncbi:MAG TPA: TetR/AcrR family transcriptional regulator [Pseudonocardia sp.]